MSLVTSYLERRAKEIEAQMEEDVDNILIHEERPGTYRVMCLTATCLGKEHFDVFGTMAPQGANGDGECTVVQRILEHLALCTPGKQIAATRVMKHRTDPVYNLKVKWQK